MKSLFVFIVLSMMASPSFSQGKLKHEVDSFTKNELVYDNSNYTLSGGVTVTRVARVKKESGDVTFLIYVKVAQSSSFCLDDGKSVILLTSDDNQIPLSSDESINCCSVSCSKYVCIYYVNYVARLSSSEFFAAKNKSITTVRITSTSGYTNVEVKGKKQGNWSKLIANFAEFE